MLGGRTGADGQEKRGDPRLRFGLVKDVGDGQEGHDGED